MYSDIIYQLFMGILQGLTEWLPVSSSGHLVIAQHFFDVEERTLFDAILHLGTLLAMTTYFRKDIKPIITFKTPLTFKIILASIPIIIVGFIFSDVIEAAFASARVASIFLVINGFILIINIFIKDQKTIKLEDISKKNVILIGIFQVFALFPGISRSGTTITTGRVLAIDWKAAAKFSFFISFLPVAGAVWFQVFTSWEEFQPIYLLGFFMAFIVGYASIDLMMRILSQGRFHYFGIYTIILGLVLVAYLI